MFYFVVAVLLLIIAHIFRMHRWQQFIIIYERPARSKLLGYLAIGYGVNYFLPFRIGDIMRAWLTGRRLKNGFPFALATVVMDYCLDVPVVGGIFAFMYLHGNEEVRETFFWYCGLMLILLVGGLGVYFFSNSIKQAAKYICSIFNRISDCIHHFCSICHISRTVNGCLVGSLNHI